MVLGPAGRHADPAAAAADPLAQPRHGRPAGDGYGRRARRARRDGTPADAALARACSAPIGGRGSSCAAPRSRCSWASPHTCCGMPATRMADRAVHLDRVRRAGRHFAMRSERVSLLAPRSASPTARWSLPWRSRSSLQVLLVIVPFARDARRPRAARRRALAARRRNRARLPRSSSNRQGDPPPLVDARMNEEMRRRRPRPGGHQRCARSARRAARFDHAGFLRLKPTGYQVFRRGALPLAAAVKTKPSLCAKEARRRVPASRAGRLCTTHAGAGSASQRNVVAGLPSRRTLMCLAAGGDRMRCWTEPASEESLRCAPATLSAQGSSRC